MCSHPPVFKRCLICLPLRYGLMLWGCFKVLVSSIIVVVVCRVLYVSAILLQYEEESFRVVPSITIFFFMIGVVATVDVVQSIILIVGCYKKNIKMLKKYYTFSTYMVVLTTVWAIYYVGLTIYNMYTINYNHISTELLISELVDVLGYFAGAGLQYYIMLLVRSQILELDNACELKFARNNDPERVLDVNNSNGRKGI